MQIKVFLLQALVLTILVVTRAMPADAPPPARPASV